MKYQYTLSINGVQRRSKTMAFRPNVIAQMVEDLQIVGGHIESFEMKVKVKKGK